MWQAIKKYILKKIDLKFRNPKFNILCKFLKCVPFWVKGPLQWCHLGTSNNDWIRLLILQFLEKLKIYAKLVSETVKFICNHLYITIIYTKVFFTTWTSHSHWAIGSSVRSVAEVTLSKNVAVTYDLSNLSFFFFLSDCTFDATFCILGYISSNVTLFVLESLCERCSHSEFF